MKINKKKVLEKWAPVLENFGIKDKDKLEWLSEYAEKHFYNEHLANDITKEGQSILSKFDAIEFPKINFKK